MSKPIMTTWEDILVDETYTLLQTMKVIDEASLQCAIVINPNGKLLGIVTDGDIRRAILKGMGLNANIKEVMNAHPIVGRIDESRSHHIQLLKANKLRHLPILDQDKIVDLILLDEDHQVSKKNTVLLMVGGLGTRLRPLTNEIPKPMLHVGGKPLLYTIIEGFKQYGFTDFILSVNYKKEIIQEYFRDGGDFGIEIDYVEETQRMGTAGALSLLAERPSKPMIVMNGDLLTQINYEQLLQFHLSQKAVATMCVREYEYQIPYGVIETNEARLVSIKEKPVHKSFVNAGIYILNPEAWDYIPENCFFDMPDLFQRIIDDKKIASVFPIREYWLDIGRIEDFERANEEFKEQYV